MNMRKQVAALGLALASVGAHAVTVTFDELQTPTLAFHDTVVSGGFVFTSDVPDNLGVWGDEDFSLFKADLLGASLFADAGGSTVTMTAAGGLSFALEAIDFADVTNEGFAGTLRLTFDYAAGGIAVRTLELDAEVGLQTFTFAEQGLARVFWAVAGGEAVSDQFDNIRATPVPEPGTTALMLGGLALLGAAGRRRLARRG